VVPTLPPREWRFSRDELMRVAQKAKLGFIDALIPIFGTPPVPVKAVARGGVPPARLAEGSYAAHLRAVPSPRVPAVLCHVKAAAPSRLKWHEQADTLVRDVRGALERRAAEKGRSFESVRDELLKESSMRALHAEWVRRSVPISPTDQPNRPKVGKKYFGAYVNKAHDWVRFAPGDHGADQSDEKFLSALLEGDNSPVCDGPVS
jgi:hypothetical protein